MAVDAPIGLVERGARACDVAARAVLGPRRSSVFPAPLRPLLGAASYAEASRLRRAIEGKGLSRQTWAIVPKIVELDALLRAQRRPRAPSLREVHPEVSFLKLNRDRPLAASKRKPEGRAERLALLRGWCGDAIDRALAERRALACAADDVLDAFAALWTAERIARGAAISLPPEPPRDAVRAADGDHGVARNGSASIAPSAAGSAPRLAEPGRELRGGAARAAPCGRADPRS